MLVYLADLTHTGQIVASNVFPLGAGLIGANLKRELGASVELFKYPDDLDFAIQCSEMAKEVPDVIGFSMYSWNTQLGAAYAKRIKLAYPGIVIVAGGPNWEDHYWRDFPWIDFYVEKEGVVAMVELLRTLEMCDWQVEVAKATFELPNTHFVFEGQLIKGPLLPRVKDLDTLPSPYLEGLMDKFYDSVLIPLVYWTTGCPFRCSFCQEGSSYYSAVSKRRDISAELEHIAQRVGTVKDLYISNANVGMANFDMPIAESIAHVQAKYGWPMYVHCSAGKNHKAKVLQFAETIGGRMGVAASLQSTDPTVLANVQRENISTEDLVAVARQGSRIDAQTYSEIILNLPGDSVAAHTQSLRDAVNSGVSYLRMYQVILLPETEMNTQETRDKFGLHTAVRIMPRCFGRYTFQGEQFNAAEVEEIVIKQNSLSFTDYVECRELDLTVEIIHNTGLFRELYGLCSVRGYEWFDLLLRFHARRRQFVGSLFDHFREDSIKPLWASRDEALNFAQSNLDEYLQEQLGTNELFNAKAVAFFNLQEPLHDAMYSIALDVFPQYQDYLDQAKVFSLERKRDLLSPEPGQSRRFDYDFPALVEMDFCGDPDSHKRTVEIEFSHDAEQRAMIDQLVHQYGRSTTGLGRIMLRAHIKKLFRKMTADGITTDRGFETSYRRSSNLAGD
jgi:hypothetical protein